MELPLSHFFPSIATCFACNFYLLPLTEKGNRSVYGETFAFALLKFSPREMRNAFSGKIICVVWIDEAGEGERGEWSGLCVRNCRQFVL